MILIPSTPVFTIIKPASAIVSILSASSGSVVCEFSTHAFCRVLIWVKEIVAGGIPRIPLFSVFDLSNTNNEHGCGTSRESLGSAIFEWRIGQFSGSDWGLKE